MSFTTKKYTRPVLVNELRKVSVRNYTDLNSFANAFSPRAGLRSAKLAALKSVITNAQLRTVFNHYSNAERKRQLVSLVKN